MFENVTKELEESFFQPIFPKLKLVDTTKKKLKIEIMCKFILQLRVARWLPSLSWTRSQKWLSLSRSHFQINNQQWNKGIVDAEIRQKGMEVVKWQKTDPELQKQTQEQT